MLAANGPAYADAWTLAGRSRAGVDYDDNVRLSINDAIATSDLSAEVAATLGRQGGNFSLALEPRVVAVRYKDYASLNRTEQYLALSAQQISERRGISLALNGAQDTTLTSEVGLTGLTVTNKRHRSAALTLSPSMQWTERFSTGAQLYAAAHRYIDADFTGLVDYNYGMAAFSSGYGLGELSKLSLQASVGKLQVPDTSSSDKTNLSATLSYTTQLGQRWQAVASFGPSEIRANHNRNHGTVYELSATRKSELLNMRLALTRDVTPTGQGALTRRDQASLSFYRPLSERLSVGVAGQWVRNRNVLPSGGLELNAVRYGDASANLNWKLAPTWRLSLNFGYAQQSRSTVDGVARRKHAGLNINWSGLTHVL